MKTVYISLFVLFVFVARADVALAQLNKLKDKVQKEASSVIPKKEEEKQAKAVEASPAASSQTTATPTASSAKAQTTWYVSNAGNNSNAGTSAAQSFKTSIKP